MSKAKYEIGENEKHVIFVNASPFLKYIRIEVDGERVVNQANFQPFSKNFELDIGDVEKHNVQISAGTLYPIKLFVDGIEIQEM